MFKKQEGITLVALVITIIVLLILAGVSISLVVGNNGVLTQASTAVMENKIADAREALNMALAATETIYYGKWTSQTGTSRQDVYYSEEEKTLVNQLSNLGYTIENSDVEGIFNTDGAEIIVVDQESNEAFVFNNVKVKFDTGKATIDSTITIYPTKADAEAETKMLYTTAETSEVAE